MPHLIMQEQDQYAQVLQNAMELCHYDTSIRSEILDWFEESILPFIRPGPKSKWVPTLTHHNTAFEPSINTRGDGPNDKNVRITIEPIGPQAKSETDKWNQEIPLELLKKLREKIPELDLELFTHFSKALFITPKDKWPKFEQPIPEASPSCFLAFDIDRSKGVPGIGPKAYLFPQLKSLQTGISPGSIIEEAITQLHDDEKFDVIQPLEMIMEYLQEPGSTLTLNDVEMIGFDLTSLDQNPRLKIYAHSWRNTFNAAEDVYTLGGLLPENKDQLDSLEEFWKLLFNDEHETAKWKSSPLTPLDPKDHERNCFIYSFEITPGELVPEMKVHFPMWCFLSSDEDLRRRLDLFFALKGWKGLVGEYEKDLGMIFPTRDVEKKSGLHTYVSYAKSKEGEDYVTVYWAGEAVQVKS